MTNWPLGFRSASKGVRVGNLLEIVDCQVSVGGLGDGQEVEDGVGGAAEDDSDGNGVFEGLAGQDVERFEVQFK